jgi:hypothetical protein
LRPDRASSRKPATAFREEAASGGPDTVEEAATSAFNRPDWSESAAAAPRTWAAAAPVVSDASATPTMLLVTSPVPDAAWATLRTIS